MASPFSVFLALSLLLLSLSLATARPCKTFIISTYSSLLPENPDSNPNPTVIAVFAEVHPRFLQLRHHHLHRHPHRFFFTRPGFAAVDRPEIEVEDELRFQRPRLPPFEEEFSSFRARTKDILSVVASLLFGAACGALTAGTMYLVWSLFNHRNEDSHRSLEFSSDDDDDNDNNDVFNPKKNGYVAITANPDVKLAAVTAPAKESA